MSSDFYRRKETWCCWHKHSTPLKTEPLRWATFIYGLVCSYLETDFLGFQTCQMNQHRPLLRQRSLQKVWTVQCNPKPSSMKFKAQQVRTCTWFDFLDFSYIEIFKIGFGIQQALLKLESDAQIKSGENPLSSNFPFTYKDGIFQCGLCPWTFQTDNKHNVEKYAVWHFKGQHLGGQL